MALTAASITGNKQKLYLTPRIWWVCVCSQTTRNCKKWSSFYCFRNWIWWPGRFPV